MSLFCWTQRKIFWKMCFRAPLTSTVFSFLLWKSMVPQNSLVTNFLQNIFCCVQQNKEIHTCLELIKGGINDDNFNFWVNYPFKINMRSNPTTCYYSNMQYSTQFPMEVNLVAILIDYNIWFTPKFWADLLDYLKRTNCAFKRETFEIW